VTETCEFIEYCGKCTGCEITPIQENFPWEADEDEDENWEECPACGYIWEEDEDWKYTYLGFKGKEMCPNCGHIWKNCWWKRY